jgi:hypothetical protein
MQTVISISIIFSILIGPAYNEMKWPTGYGFNNKDPRYFIKIKRIVCENNPALVNLTHCNSKLERNTNGKYSVGLVFAASEPKMTVSSVFCILLSGSLDFLLFDSSKCPSSQDYRPTFIDPHHTSNPWIFVILSPAKLDPIW